MRVLGKPAVNLCASSPNRQRQAGRGTKADTETEAQVGTEAGTGTDTDTEVQVGTKTGTDTGAEAGTGRRQADAKW